MDMGDPFRGVVPRKMTATELAGAIMQDVAAGLDAAFLYQVHIDAADDERAREVLAHIRDEEKQHAAEFLERSVNCQEVNRATGISYGK